MSTTILKIMKRIRTEDRKSLPFDAITVIQSMLYGNPAQVYDKMINELRHLVKELLYFNSFAATSYGDFVVNGYENVHKHVSQYHLLYCRFTRGRQMIEASNVVGMDMSKALIMMLNKEDMILDKDLQDLPYVFPFNRMVVSCVSESTCFDIGCIMFIVLSFVGIMFWF